MTVKTYVVTIMPKAQRELARVPKKHRKQIEERIESLAGNPRPAGSKALQGKVFSGLYRVNPGTTASSTASPKRAICWWW